MLYVSALVFTNKEFSVKESQRAPIGGSGDKLRFVKIRVACPIMTRMYYVMMRCYICSWDRLGIDYW